MNFEAECVGTPEAAHLALSATLFAIVVLDLQLRDEVSLELFEEIRDRYPAVSVVIATGHGGFEVARRSIQMDVVDFLTKPIPLSELENRADRAGHDAWRLSTLQSPRLLPPHVEGLAATAPYGQCGERSELLASRILNIEAIERELIMEALWRSGDNRKVAADMLGISERKLYYRLTQYHAT